MPTYNVSKNIWSIGPIRDGLSKRPSLIRICDMVFSGNRNGK